MENEDKLTPMMQQWANCKKAAKGALLFFRLGDFYEAFGPDAEIIARELDLTLTKRQTTPMCGVPWHAAENYIDRLVAKGYRLAIAEQMEDPSSTKGIVKRQITRFITPGTLIASSLLPDAANNFIVALTQVGSLFGVATCDLTTGELMVTELEDSRDLLGELYRLKPAEIVLTNKFKEKHEKIFADLALTHSPLLSIEEQWHFDHDSACSFLTNHFKVAHLDGFGIKGLVAAINAAGALLAYLEMELSLPTAHIRSIRPYFLAESLSIDRVTQKNLELTQPLHEGATLLSVIDKTVTPMGARLLCKWVKNPLLSVEQIHQRQEAISALISAAHLPKLRLALAKIRDLERLIMRISSNYASPRDFIQLKTSLEALPALKTFCMGLGSHLLSIVTADLVDLSALTQLLERALVNEPPLRVGDAPLFKAGYSLPLDELSALGAQGKEWVARYQATIREETGIKTAKVGYNRVFGYYIEVSSGQAGQMPSTFHRKQTLAGAERFISPALKEYEYKILSAEEKRGALENELFLKLREEVGQYAAIIQKVAAAIALLDALAGLAETARLQGYVRPQVEERGGLFIEEGRHPVVETLIAKNQFIANDTALEGQLMLITGPNMAGKSTYIRQVALLVILAQMGSFVPAKKMSLGIVDKIFTRIGASDDLARGQSTFMVEMSETAHILNNATDRSLVILDEIGRGTSTYDGVAIAWSVAEYLLSQEGKKAKTLFATHYFELTALERVFPAAVNYHASVKEWNDEILFLHKILKGKADRSYGIHVARLAGLPKTVITKANEILQSLEQGRKGKTQEKKDLPFTREEQLSFF